MMMGLVFLSLLLYFPSFFFLHDMIQIRIGIAGGLLLLVALPLLLKKKKLTFIIACLLISLMHYSSLLFTLLAFVNQHSINKLKYLIFFGLCFLFSMLKIDFLLLVSKLPLGAISMKLAQYNSTFEIRGAERVNVFNVLFLIKMMMGLVLLYLVEEENDEKQVLFTKMYFISLCSFLLFSATAILAFRVSELFALIEFIVMAYMVKQARIKLIPVTLITIFAAIYLVLTLHVEKSIQEYYLVIW